LHHIPSCPMDRPLGPTFASLVPTANCSISKPFAPLTTMAAIQLLRHAKPLRCKRLIRPHIPTLWWRSIPAVIRLRSLVASVSLLRSFDGLTPWIPTVFRPKQQRARPELVWQHEAWRVRIRPIPVRVEARGFPRRLIGIRSLGAAWIDGWTPIRDAVRSKARRYGELDLPLVVAVNADTFNLDPIDEVQALFGQEQVVVTMGAVHTERLERAPNGAWWGPSGPHGRKCSGAWLFKNLSPYTVARRSHTLYVNPWAHFAPPQSFLQMPHAIVANEGIKRVGGRSLSEVFELELTWPE
jgi:hypothetical protein